MSQEPDRIVAAWEREWAQRRDQHAQEVEALRRAVERATDLNKTLRAENRRLTRGHLRQEARSDAEKATMRAGWERREKRLLDQQRLLIIFLGLVAGGAATIKVLDALGIRVL